jgi:hypothetical protein
MRAGSSPPPAALDPERLLTVLARHRVRYVLVGALAARLQGFPRLTADADITPARSGANLARLAAALRELKARIYTESVPEGLPFDVAPETLVRSELWNFVTDAGRLDVVFQPAGTQGYEDLNRGAVRFDVFGVKLHVANLRDITRSKAATGRTQDLQDVEVLRAMLGAGGRKRKTRKKA